MPAGRPASLYISSKLVTILSKATREIVKSLRPSLLKILPAPAAASLLPALPPPAAAPPLLALSLLLGGAAAASAALAIPAKSISSSLLRSEEGRGGEGGR